MACQEIKEAIKGHRNVAESVRGQRANYIGKRHMTRIMSDAYGKGIVRGAVEYTTLRVYIEEFDVITPRPSGLLRQKLSSDESICR